MAKGNDTGSSGMSSSPETRANKPPVIAIEGSKNRTVKVGEPLVLVAKVTDDGVPKATTEEQARNRARRAAASVKRRVRQRRELGQQRGSGQRICPGLQRDGSPVDIWRIPPSQGSVRKSNGLHLSWFHYRGPGPVQFDPPQIKTWEDLRVGANSPWAPVWFAPPMPPDGELTTTVKFSAPGTYVLRGARRRRPRDDGRGRDGHGHAVRRSDLRWNIAYVLAVLTWTTAMSSSSAGELLKTTHTVGFLALSLAEVVS